MEIAFKRDAEHKNESSNITARIKKSHLLLHATKTRHRRVWMNDFKIIGRGYSSNFKRKISESLFIKKLKPDLNVQKESLKLSLYN